MILKQVEPKKYLKLRIIATLIDYGFFMLLFTIYIECFGHETHPGTMEINGLPALPIFIYWFLYFVVLETVNQATPGHDICKLIVVRSNGDKTTLYDTFKRRIMDFIDIGIPCLICVNYTPKHQRLGDLLADTVVVKKSDITETEAIF